MDEGPSELQKRISDAAALIHEHCDSVEILVSLNIDGRTKFMHEGRGNWYARQGMAQSFIKIDTAQENAHEMRAVIARPREED